MLKDILVKQTC